MKTIGLLGGMSWESTMTYYQLINEAVRDKLGGLHSGKILLHSVDFAEIEEHQATGAWDKSAVLLAEAAQGLERAGADLLLICTNTMHKVAPQIQAQLQIPLLHIADATAAQLKSQGVDTVALLGTQYTMTQDFYKARITASGCKVLIPNEADIALVNRVIYDELCLGILSDASRQSFQRIIADLGRQGAQGVILGCTEIGLLIHPQDSSLPVFDTTQIHALRAAQWAMEA